LWSIQNDRWPTPLTGCLRESWVSSILLSVDFNFTIIIIHVFILPSGSTRKIEKEVKKIRSQ